MCQAFRVSERVSAGWVDKMAALRLIQQYFIDIRTMQGR